MSRHIDAKAVRLLATGAVEPVADCPGQFTVRGDTANYTTVVTATARLCTCKRWRESMLDCSHIAAVVRRLNADPGELAMMDEAVALRRARDGAVADELFARLGA